MEVIQTGLGELIQRPDIQAFRQSNRQKPKGLVTKLMSEKEAVSQFIQDGDYIGTELYGSVRAPMSITREILRQGKKNLRLAGQGVYPLPKGGTEEDRLAAVQECVADFITRQRLTPEGVFFGLGGQLAICRRLEFPLAVKENLRETLGYEMEKYFPLPIEDVCFDYQIIGEDKTSKQLSLLLVMARKSNILDYCQLHKVY